MGSMYVGWEEVLISNEKGRREVHYFLKRRDGKDSDLAVVGKERTIRHMSYSFAINNNSPSLVSPPCLKLKSRREVLDWLSSVVSDSSSNGASQVDGSSLYNLSFDADASALKDLPVKKSELHSKEFLWLGSAWTCRKRRKHYKSFCRNGITISVHDFVYVLAEENKRLVAYLEDLYEDSRGNKMVVVRWFHKIDEVGIVLPPDFNDREIFFSLCLQDLSVECIDGLATILSPQHFEKYLKEATHTLWEPFLCHRQFDNDDITDFDITQVQGYWKQDILRFMYTSSTPKHFDFKPFDDSLEFHDGDDNDDYDAIKTRPNKKHRRSRSKDMDQHLNDKKDVRDAAHVDTQKLCDVLVSSGRDEICGLKEPKSTASLSSKEMKQQAPLHQQLVVNSQIEVLSQDSGIRGCWFRAVVIKRSKDKVKVRYQDIRDAEDEAKNVEEWVLASRIAPPDELGIRLCGRTTIRPHPSTNKDKVSLGFVDVGTLVDAWWHNGWWEGIVVRRDSEVKIQVYFPGEKRMSIFGGTDLRHSQEWLCNKWNCVNGRADLVSSILSGLESREDGGKSCDGTRHSIQLLVSDNRQHNSSFGDLFLPKVERSACKKTAPCSELQNDMRKEIKAVPNLAQDDLLAQLRWKSSRKRRRGTEGLQRRGSSGSKQHSDGSSSSSREDLVSSPDCQRFLITNSLKFDHEICKYRDDSLISTSIPPLTGLVLSR